MHFPLSLAMAQKLQLQLADHMAEQIDEFASQAFLQRPREEIHPSLRSSTGELISALQERDAEEARQIAARLHRDLHLCESDRPSYLLAHIITLLHYDDVFQHCDELSVWLLALERELHDVKVSCRHGKEGDVDSY